MKKKKKIFKIKINGSNKTKKKNKERGIASWFLRLKMHDS